MKTVALLITATALAPAVALAQPACPTEADMRAGVVFTLSDGGTELHTQTRKGWVQIHAVFAEGDASLLELFHGLYLKGSVPVVGGVPQVGDAISFASDGDLRAWDAPRPNRKWQNQTPGGGTAQSGALAAFQIGGCSYEAFDVAIVFSDDEDYSETYRYIPQLSTGLLIKTQDGETTDAYVYTDVRARE